MKNFFFCMMLYPQVQLLGQQEVDRFMNEENRLPSLKDWSRGALPFVTCIVQEVLRWHPVSSQISLNCSLYVLGMLNP